MPLNERIALLRIQAGLTKAELGRRVGTSDVTIAYWERGVISEIGHVKLMRLAAEFGITVSELLDDPMQPRRDDELIRGLADLLEAAEAPSAEGGYMWDASECADWLREQADTAGGER